ncbi:hypothetical protein EDD37DRAFT_481361 [Exophiala viscosa]|uniref:uncharacterized protein n=1 Tax=Exophiala viscosa TaxID=2486360 RepID=UPI00218EDD0B|nr:hypothetical protein EDD37DRAFT_481361 [Exophiala viscosa]
MIPLAAVIVLGIVVAVSGITFVIAMFNEAKRLKNMDADMILPVTESAAEPAAAPVRPMRQDPLARSGTPEAEYPPSLPDDDLESLAEAETPPPLPTPVRDSTNEIIHLYTNEARTILSGARTAPATMTAFAQADSKWGYIGLKRAQSNLYEGA